MITNALFWIMKKWRFLSCNAFIIYHIVQWIFNLWFITWCKAFPINFLFCIYYELQCQWDPQGDWVSSQLHWKCFTCHTFINMIIVEDSKISMENYLTIKTQTEDNDRRPSLAELQAEDRVSISSWEINEETNFERHEMKILLS